MSLHLTDCGLTPLSTYEATGQQLTIHEVQHFSSRLLCTDDVLTSGVVPCETTTVVLYVSAHRNNSHVTKCTIL